MGQSWEIFGPLTLQTLLLAFPGTVTTGGVS